MSLAPWARLRCLTERSDVVDRVGIHGRVLPMDPVIQVRNLGKTFTTRRKAPGLGASFRALFRPEIVKIRAVDNISFEVGRGEVLAFIGLNGAGKSTTIKLIT